MNHEVELKLQAWLDGELSPSESARMAALVEQDAGARALHSELQQTSLTLRTNELERRLPESREFYWSKIEREIQRLEREPRSSVPWWLAMLRRNLAAVSGVGVATAILVVGAFQLNWVSPDMLEEIDNPAGDATSFSFRSEAQKMTVVWISNPSEPVVEPLDSELEEELFQ